MPKRITSFAERPTESDAHDQVARQEGEADLERAVAEHELQVERREEEPGEHRCRPEDADDVRDRDVAQPEEAERHERRRRPATRSRGRPPAAAPATPSSPSVCGGRPALPGCRSRSRRPRASASAVTVTAPAMSRRRSRRRPRRRRQSLSVRTTTSTPIGTLTRKIQCQLRTSVRMPPRSTPMLPPPEATKPKMPIAFARSAGSVKSVIISESATAETTAPPRPCTARAADQHLLRGREAAGERGDREERDAEQEQAPVAEEVAQPAAEEQEAAEGEQVRVHDPRERRLGEPEVLLDRRQRDADDRRRRGRSSGRRGRGRTARASGCGCPGCHRHHPLGPVCSVHEALDGPAERELIGAARDEFRPGPEVLSGMATPAPHAVPFAIRGPIARADLPGLCDRVCALLRESGAERRPLRRERRRAGRRDGRRARAAPARRAAARLPVRLRNASSELRELVAFMGLARRPAGVAALGSNCSGRPKSGKTASVSRKNVNPTILPCSSSSTWSAHGS